MGNFAAVLKHLRVSHGMTQEQLASMLKVSRSRIGMYESEGRGFESLPAHQTSNDTMSFIGCYRCLFFICISFDYFLTTFP